MESDFERAIDDIQAEIMAEARRTYSETVIQHWLNPKRLGKIDDPDGFAHVIGPCGDTMMVFLRVSGRQVGDAKFMTDGCGTTIACGDMAAELAIGTTAGEAFAISPSVLLRHLGGLPEADQHCASLASTTLRKAVLSCPALKQSLHL